MQIRLADERDMQLLTHEYLRFVSRDMEGARRYALLNVQVDRTLLAMEGVLPAALLHWGHREALSEGLAQITGLRVSQARLDAGVGDSLLEAAIADMQSFFTDKGSQLRRAFLILAEDPPTEELFARHGFQLQTTLPNHFAEGKVGQVYVWEP